MLYANAFAHMHKKHHIHAYTYTHFNVDDYSYALLCKALRMC